MKQTQPEHIHNQNMKGYFSKVTRTLITVSLNELFQCTQNRNQFTKLVDDFARPHTYIN